MAAGKENITGTLVPTGPSRENSKAQIQQMFGVLEKSLSFCF
jgi:hypothetical protein